MDLKTKIKQMIVDRLFLNVTAGQIKDDTNLMEAYDIDSVALFELAVGLEDEFGVPMDEADFQLDTFRTVNAIAKFVEARQG